VKQKKNKSKKYSWLTIFEILAVHEKLLALFGGGTGIRDINLLKSALDRPLNYAVYEKPDLFELASLYADGIVNNHPFIDGNKRTGFVAAILFLESNDAEFIGAETEAVIMTLGLADKSIGHMQYADWLKLHSKIK
jgi:death on curing protein